MPMSDDGNEYDNYQDELDNDNYREDDSNSSDGSGEEDNGYIKNLVDMSQTTKNKIEDVDEDDKLEEIEDSADEEEDNDDDDTGDDSEDSFEFTETIQ